MITKHYGVFVCKPSFQRRTSNPCSKGQDNIAQQRSVCQNALQTVRLEVRYAKHTVKTLGVTAIEQALAENTEAIVSVRGKDKYVVMSFEQYSHLRTCELEAAIHETRKDLAEGRFS